MKLLTICINNNSSNKGERSEIINAAFNIHLEKRRKMIDQETLVKFTFVESKSENESESENENGFSEDRVGSFLL